MIVYKDTTKIEKVKTFFRAHNNNKRMSAYTLTRFFEGYLIILNIQRKRVVTANPEPDFKK